MEHDAVPRAAVVSLHGAEHLVHPPLVMPGGVQGRRTNDLLRTHANKYNNQYNIRILLRRGQQVGQNS